MRVLDEVAAAINLARSAYPQTITSAFGLEQQFPHPIGPKGWDAIRQHLTCAIPPLVFVQGHWFLPEGFATVWDLVEVAADAHPNWDPPGARTVAAWRNAQVFAGVRDALVDALGISPEDVNRETRLIDLIG